jgi:eukaryotic-like serine/threonine-protein kinase
MPARSRLAALALASICACGGPAPAAAPVLRLPKQSTRAPVVSGPATASSSTTTGSSDGVSCEEAQSQNVEELDLHGGAQPDLTVSAFAPTLDNGAYLETCEVPSTSKVEICVAVKAGQPIGVSVAIDPSDPELELCVAKQVRAMTFVSHPKMDVVRVRF